MSIVRGSIVVVWMVLAAVAGAAISPEPGPQRSGLRAEWIGQDGHDLVGKSRTAGGNGVQDVHIVVHGLPVYLRIEEVHVKGYGSGHWQFGGRPQHWRVEALRRPRSPRLDLFFEPEKAEDGRPYEVILRLSNGDTKTIWAEGGPVDPNRRMPRQRVQATWIGQDGRDLVGLGAAVGPDGAVDTGIRLTRLADRNGIAAVKVIGPLGLRWETGPNPSGYAHARLIVDKDDASTADLVFGCERNIKGRRLAIRVVYEDGSTDMAELTAGALDPRLRVEPPAPIGWIDDLGLEAGWLGQDARDGRVRVRISGRPPGRIRRAVLSNAFGQTWTFDPRRTDRPEHESLQREEPGARSVVFSWLPTRDESGSPLLLRFDFTDGRLGVVEFEGQRSEPGLEISRGSRATVARPSDDLQRIVEQYDRITMASGIYELSKPLELRRPIAIEGQEGVTLRFAQGSGSDRWTSAIKIHHGRTLLSGFRVRFDGPVRWDWGVSYGPSVIGTTDDRDAYRGDSKHGIVLEDLDIEAPESSEAWALEPRLLRLVTASSGRVAGNVFRGGVIEFAGGPWEIVENTHRGTRGESYAYDAFAGHNTRELTFADNVFDPAGDAGLTFRLLVLTGSGVGDVVSGNRARGLGRTRSVPLADLNAPEMILTEAYRLAFEGAPTAIEVDGRILRIPEPQGGPASAGSVVAIVQGPHAGTYARVAQAIDPQTYLLAEPLPTSSVEAVSILRGFVGERFVDNVIDARRARGYSAPLVLAGGHFGTVVEGNRIHGGVEAFRIQAPASERPVRWGWSHVPMFDLTIAENRWYNSGQGGVIRVDQGPQIQPSRDRVYLTGLLRGNQALWSRAKLDQLDGDDPTALRIGDPRSLDPRELRLDLRENRGLVPDSSRHQIEVHIDAALLSGLAKRNARATWPRPAQATRDRSTTTRIR